MIERRIFSDNDAVTKSAIAALQDSFRSRDKIVSVDCSGILKNKSGNNTFMTNTARESLENTILGLEE